MSLVSEPGFSIQTSSTTHESAPASFASSSRLPGLDHVRAAAILLVWIFHYRLFKHPDWLTHFGNFGWTGVDLFFVLSGYLIGGELMKNAVREGRIDFRSFYIKRFFRILPPFLLVVGVYYFFPDSRETVPPAPFLRYLTFTQNIGLNVHNARTFTHCWSLCIEEHFYCLLPLVLAILLAAGGLRKGRWLIPGLVLAGLVIRLLTWKYLIAPDVGTDQFSVSWYKWMYFPTWTRLDGLLAGVGVAALVRFKPVIADRMLRRGNLLLITGLIALFGCWLLCDNNRTWSASIFGFPLISAAYGLVLMSALASNSILHRWSSSVTRWIAVLSYSAYLSHKIVIHLLQAFVFPKTGVEVAGTAAMIICFVACGLVAWIMHLLIEKPFMKMRMRFLQKKALMPIPVI